MRKQRVPTFQIWLFCGAFFFIVKEYHRTAKTQGIFFIFIFFIFAPLAKLARHLRSILTKSLICKHLRRAAGRAVVSR
jgi:hypothetical protein